MDVNASNAGFWPFCFVIGPARDGPAATPTTTLAATAASAAVKWPCFMDDPCLPLRSRPPPDSGTAQRSPQRVKWVVVPTPPDASEAAAALAGAVRRDRVRLGLQPVW